MERKRSKNDIIFDMLAITIEKRGKIKPTHLMYKANLSHRQMSAYLDEMMEKGLIEKTSPDKERKSKSMISITKKGVDFFSKYRQLREFESAFGL